MRFEVTSPYHGGVIGTVPVATEETVESAIASAYALFGDRHRWLALHQRIEILERVANILSERKEELALQASAEGGKPLIDSRVEVARAISGIKLAAETINNDAGHVIPIAGTAAGLGRLAVTQKEPVGVVVAVSAFNHPLNLVVHQVGAAVAAGCPCLVKPAEDTPLSCRALVDIFYEAGLPEDYLRFILPIDVGLSEKMVTDQRTGFFSFIGSARVGWMLRAKLAPGTRCALEHGGAAPLIVANDACMESAVPAITKGGFYHAGQVCVSVQRVFAESGIATAFAEQMAIAANELSTGDPERDNIDVGPLIRAAEVDRVDEWVQEAIAGGAELLCGGKRLENNCYMPTVLRNPPVNDRVSTQEIFGPVVCIYDYDELDNAIAQANALPYAFQAAVFTQDMDRAMYVYRHIAASAVMVNDHTAFRVDGMPFAGLRQSGYGVGGIPYTIEDMQVDKMLVINSSALL